jgi:hypothetical protein
MSAEQESKPQGTAGNVRMERIPEAPPRRVPLAIAGAAAVAIVGGVACGCLTGILGEWGFMSLWPLGFIAGTISRRLTVAPSRIAAWCQVAACVLAMLLAVVWWLRWNTVQGEKGWSVSVTYLPTFVEEYTVSAVIAAIAATVGGCSAYSTAGRRYRLVREYID